MSDPAHTGAIGVTDSFSPKQEVYRVEVPGPSDTPYRPFPVRSLRMTGRERVRRHDSSRST